MSTIVLKKIDAIPTYPSSDFGFSPSESYPEYKFKGEISNEFNPVYKAIRDTLILANLDESHIGTDEWNPLGVYIKPGQSVLLKPNWVESENPVTSDNLASLVTNPSIVRPIIDYVLIALKGTGKVIIADAPMQGCDLSKVFSITGYDKLFAFYKEHDISLTVADLRKYSVHSRYNGVFEKPVETENSLGSITINLKKNSLHSEHDEKIPLYKVEDYPQVLTQYYHSKGNHIYEINRLALEADVIINIPKPKTHRLAGITGACKNFVGVTFEKACLPHRKEGDAETGHGDAYFKHSKFKEWMWYFNEKRTIYSRSGKYLFSKINDSLMKACYVMGTFTSRDTFRIGSWYGNDTIWRTIIDLNKILLFADRYGEIKNTQQRLIIHFGDMIIGGQKSGPVKPSPKYLGIVLFADNALLFDRVVCEIMGFRADRFPIFYNSNSLKVFGFDTSKSLESQKITSNIQSLCNTPISHFPCIKEWYFEPHPCWKGYIEK